MRTPYIGITGFTTPQEVDHTALIMDNEGYPNAYNMMFGILTSSKRIADPTRRGSRSPAVDEIPAIVQAAPRGGIAMIHYHNPTNTGFGGEVAALMETARCYAMQLNISWPDIEEIQHIEDAMSGVDFTFQIGKQMVEGMSETDLVKRLAEYADFATYALVDMSMGRGIPIDVKRNKALLDITEEALPNARLTVAGGLDGSNVYDTLTAIGRDRIGFDAEGRLMGTNGLDMDKVSAYVVDSWRYTRQFRVLS